MLQYNVPVRVMVEPYLWQNNEVATIQTSDFLMKLENYAIHISPSTMMQIPHVKDT